MYDLSLKEMTVGCQNVEIGGGYIRMSGKNYVYAGILIGGIIGFFINYNGFNRDNISSDFEISPINLDHREKPVDSPVYSSNIGFSYRLTQVFFETNESEQVEADIYNLLKDCNINYENLYYTKEGYYTADLIGYGAYMTEEKCKEESRKLQDAINNWIMYHPYNLLAGHQYSIQYHYLTH